jgi:amidase
MKGTPSTMNFKYFRNFIAERDAVVVERIRNSGAVIIGKTNVPKSLMDYQVKGDLYPEGKSPYGELYTPGGSTGGGAAALAAGFTPLELGSDIGGSVRLPAAFCGLFGLKPTDRTVPPDGNIPIPKQAKTFLIHLASAGPLARNIADLKVLWKVITGPHACDRNIPRIEWQRPTSKPLSGYRIAWVDGWPGFPISRPVNDAIRKLVMAFEQKGGTAIKGIPDNNLHNDTLDLWISLFPYVTAQGVPWIIRQLLKLEIKSTFLKGTNAYNKGLNSAYKMDANHYARAMYTKNMVIERWENLFTQFDFLICPVAFGSAYKRCKIGSRITYDGTEVIYPHYVWPFTAPFNASGNPSITIPVSLDMEGLPIGVQVVGPYWSEPELIRFAGMLAELGTGFNRPSNW